METEKATRSLQEQLTTEHQTAPQITSDPWAASFSEKMKPNKRRSKHKQALKFDRWFHVSNRELFVPLNRETGL